MHILDIIIGIFLLAFVINGLRKGLIQSVLGLLGLILIIVLIVKVGTPVKFMLIQELGINEIIAMILSYILIVIFIVIIIRLVGWILGNIISVLNAGCLDKILGMIFGFLNGVLIIAIILILLDISPIRKTVRNATRDSVAVQYIRKFTHIVDSNFPDTEKLKIPIEKSMEDLDKKFTETIEQKTKN